MPGVVVVEAAAVAAADAEAEVIGTAMDACFEVNELRPPLPLPLPLPLVLDGAAAAAADTAGPSDTIPKPPLAMLSRRALFWSSFLRVTSMILLFLLFAATGTGTDTGGIGTGAPWGA